MAAKAAAVNAEATKAKAKAKTPDSDRGTGEFPPGIQDIHMWGRTKVTWGKKVPEHTYCFIAQAALWAKARGTTAKKMVANPGKGVSAQEIRLGKAARYAEWV